MPSEPTQRAMRHRAARGIIRVEVEVPSTEDAATVRRFARECRERARWPDNCTRQAEINGAEPLESIIDRIGDRGRVALTVFAAGLAAANNAELIERSERIALNFRDAADMQRRSSVLGIEGEGR